MTFKKIILILISQEDNFSDIKSNPNYQLDLRKEKETLKDEEHILPILVPFDQNMVERILFIIEISKKSVMKTTKDLAVGIELNSGTLEGIIFSLVFKSRIEKPTMISFVIQIFVRILCQHPFGNGNKRIAIVALRNLLHWIGFYLEFSSLENLLIYKHYQSFCEEVAIDLKGKDYTNPEIKEIKKIEKWIKKRIKFALKMVKFGK